MALAEGFPKSLNVQKQLEKMGEHEAAEKFAGYGTATKPAYEPICVARKPLSEPTVAKQVLSTGTGAINVDASRINTPVGNDGRKDGGNGLGVPKVAYGDFNGEYNGASEQHPESARHHVQGRWPANLILSHVSGPNGCERVGVKRVRSQSGAPTPGDGSGNGKGWTGGWAERKEIQIYADPDGTEEVEDYRCVEGCPILELNRQSGVTPSGGNLNSYKQSNRESYSGGMPEYRNVEFKRDKGGASRYFATFEPDVGAGFRYVAKASRRERNAGLPEGMTNNHPTVKSLGIMKYLVRMVTPPGGTCLDPFAGSGSTGVACVLEGFDFVGIEREEEYAEIAKRRIVHYQEETSGKLFA